MGIPKVIITPMLQLRRITKSITLAPFQVQTFRSSSKIAANHHDNLISLRNLFHRHAFPTSQLPDFLKSNKFLLDSQPSEIEKSFNILLSLNPSQDFLVSTVMDSPRVLHLEFLEKWHLGINQLGIYGITSMAIKNVLEIARKSGLNPDDVCWCINCLKELGFSEGTITRVLETVPMVITWSQDKICGKIEFLMRIGIQTREIDKVLGLFPGILAYGVENRLKPLVDEFTDLGFSLRDVRREVVREPRVLSFENGELSQCLEMLRSLKCRESIKESIFQNGELRAGYETKLRVDCLREHGLMYRDAYTVLWKEPRVILYKVEDMEKKIEFLIRRMMFDIECLVEVPEYLGVSFDKRIVPRFNVIEYLRAKGGVGDEIGLTSLVKLSRLRFYNMYVKPYPECEQIYARFAVVQNRHPVGMWKLFRPKQYQETGDDVVNIKSFVKSLL